MKVIKKMCAYLLIGFLCCSSVLVSYEKANSCEAVSVALYIGAAVLGIGMLCYGAYYISDSENQEQIKESLTNYAEMTEENAKFCYESNKKLFNDFCDYVTENGGGSASVYTAAGQAYTVNDMKEHGFPDFEDWDETMKKQGSSASSGGFGNIWDKLSFGLELLDFICDFFEDDEYGNSGSAGTEQSYFHGDDDYINRETGEVNVFYHTRAFFSDWSYSDHMWYRLYKNFYGDITGFVDEEYKEDFRFALYCSSYMRIPYVGEEEFEEYPIDYNSPMLLFKMGNSSISSMGLSYIENGSKTFTRLSDGELENINYYEMYITFKVNNSNNAITSITSVLDMINATDYSDYVYLSANVPLFATCDEAIHYIETGDFSCALNLAPELQPTPTSVPIAEKDSAVAVYCNHFNGRSVTPSDVINVNYNIANDWDGTTENLTIILNDSDDEPTVTPGLTTKPIPTLVDDDGSNTTNNYIISITNILQPIQTTVTNIYNFFIIDTGQVKNSISLDFVPTASFTKLIDAFDKMAVSFGVDEYEYTGNGDDTEVDVIVDGVDLNGVATSQFLKTDYPVISIKCPKILENYVDTEVDGQKAIIICDFEDFAVYFVRFRQFINAVLWIGMLFYIMREVRVTFIVS